MTTYNQWHTTSLGCKSYSCIFDEFWLEKHKIIDLFYTIIPWKIWTFWTILKILVLVNLNKSAAKKKNSCHVKCTHACFPKVRNTSFTADFNTFTEEKYFMMIWTFLILMRADGSTDLRRVIDNIGWKWVRFENWFQHWSSKNILFRGSVGDSSNIGDFPIKCIDGKGVTCKNQVWHCFDYFRYWSTYYFP